MRIVLLTRGRPEARYLATELHRSGCLAAIVVEQSPVTFSPSKLRRPSLRSPAGHEWILAQLRQNLGLALLAEPFRVLYDQLAWRLANGMERHFTSAHDEARWYSGPSPSFPDGVPRHEVGNLND